MYIIGNIKALDKYNRKQIKTMFIGVFISIFLLALGVYAFDSKIDIHIIFSVIKYLGLPINNLTLLLCAIGILIVNPFLLGIFVIGGTIWVSTTLLLIFSAFTDDDAKYII